MIDTLRRLAFALPFACAASPCAAYSFGAGTCFAVADGSFMPWMEHHPGQTGGFAIELDRSGYYAGENVAVTLRHAGSQLLIGFLLYAHDANGVRLGLFTPIAATTLSGALPMECANVGHTITHEITSTPQPLRATVPLVWTAPLAGAADLEFRGLVLRADPLSQNGTHFFEVSATVAWMPDGIFRDRFEPLR